MSTWRAVRTFALWGPFPAALTLAAALALGAPSVVVPTMLLTYFAGWCLRSSPAWCSRC